MAVNRVGKVLRLLNRMFRMLIGLGRVIGLLRLRSKNYIYIYNKFIYLFFFIKGTGPEGEDFLESERDVRVDNF